MCVVLIFIREPGMRHSALSRSNSCHSAARNSPGRTNTSGASRNAQRVTKWPWYPSRARSSAPMALVSVMEA
jgi:hypothetical protein